MNTITRLTLAVAFALHALAYQAVEVLAQPSKNPTYTWLGEVVSYDRNGGTVTVKVPYREHINRYIGEFKPGDKVVLTWATPRPGETEAIVYVGRYDASSSAGKWGYVLPADLVATDTAARRLTFTVAVPSAALKTLATVQPGGWIKVTTPFDQPKETAAIAAVETSAPPAPTD
jgi:hypothetical protein